MDTSKKVIYELKFFPKVKKKTKKFWFWKQNFLKSINLVKKFIDHKS